jgi:hypothetical protein
MIIQPGSVKYIEWAKDDPADASTIYPQCKVRNLETDDLIATVNLTSSDGRRFRGSYTTPQDRSGLGYYISEFIQVYSDAGHTTQGTQYADSHAVFQVSEYIQRVASVQPGPGPVIDYSVIANVIEDIYKRIQKKDLDALRKEIDDKLAEIKVMPASPTIDVSGITNSIENLKNVVDIASQGYGKSRSEISKLSKEFAGIVSGANIKSFDENVKAMAKILEKNTSQSTGSLANDAVLKTRLIKELSQEIRILQKMSDALMSSTDDLNTNIAKLSKELKDVTFVMKKS